MHAEYVVFFSLSAYSRHHYARNRDETKAVDGLTFWGDGNASGYPELVPTFFQIEFFPDSTAAQNKNNFPFDRTLVKIIFLETAATPPLFYRERRRMFCFVIRRYLMEIKHRTRNEHSFRPTVRTRFGISLKSLHGTVSISQI